MRGINKLSKKSESIRISKWVFWYVLFLAVVVFWHLLMREYSGDAVNYFSKVMESDTLFNVLKNRYNEWSSRVFVEAILILLSKDVIVWKIFNIAVYALFAFSLMRLTNYKYPQLLFGLWIIYPVIEMQSAGWIATYMNYFWPLAIGTYAFTSLDKIYHGKKFYLFEYFTFTLAVIFATNVEQMCVLYICVLSGFGVDYYIIQKSKDRLWFYILQWLIAAANLIFILICPGNSARKWSETGNWMHDFETMSIIDKGVCGFVATMKELVDGNMIFLLFVSVIFVLSILNRHYKESGSNKIQNIIMEVSFTFPFAVTITLALLKNVFGTYYEQVYSLFFNIERVDAVRWNNFKYYVPFIIYMLMMIAIVISLLNLFEDVRKNIELAYIFIIGIITRLIMGFSPTLYASGNRTFIFLDALLIFSIVRMYDYSKETRSNLPIYVYKAGSHTFTALVVFSMINNVIAICGW